MSVNSQNFEFSMPTILDADKNKMKQKKSTTSQAQEIFFLLLTSIMVPLVMTPREVYI